MINQVVGRVVSDINANRARRLSRRVKCRIQRAAVGVADDFDIRVRMRGIDGLANAVDAEVIEKCSDALQWMEGSDDQDAQQELAELPQVRAIAA